MVGGNIMADLQLLQGEAKNIIGEQEPNWVTVATLNGFLDLTAGDSKYTNYSAKLQESTHVFLCDYVPLNAYRGDKRMVIDGENYDVLLVDDPMGMHKQLEIYLRFVGR